MNIAALLAALRPVGPHTLIATDFDGTLAPLVLDPEDSQAAPGTVAALQALAARGAQVAVITGRDARTVIRLGGLDAVPGIVVAGLYGLETWRAGELSTPDEPASIIALRERLPEVLAAAGADPDVWIEDKRLSLVVHARRAADPPVALAAIRDQVEQLAGELGLEPHPGSGVLELRVPGFDKGATLRRLAAGFSAVLYLGDDLGDIPAFDAAQALRAEGAAAYGVAVLESAVDGVAAVADLTVPDAAAAVALLDALASE